MRNIALLIEYDGSDFVGWQLQGNSKERTVQGEIEGALQKILRQKVRLTGAGRTDSGVHAFGQVANFYTNSQIAESKIRSGLNGMLSHAIRIRSVHEVDLNFNSRKDAIRRRYRYVISLTPTAIYRHFCWYNPYPFAVSVLKQISRYVLGRHDFSPFCKSKSLSSNNECQVTISTWEVKSGFLTYQIEADRFLHHMVRSLVGTMMKTAEGNMTLPEFRSLFLNGRRDQVGKTAPARGLFLEKIYYLKLKT